MSTSAATTVAMRPRANSRNTASVGPHLIVGLGQFAEVPKELPMLGDRYPLTLESSAWLLLFRLIAHEQRVLRELPCRVFCRFLGRALDLSTLMTTPCWVVIWLSYGCALLGWTLCSHVPVSDFVSSTIRLDTPVGQEPENTHSFAPKSFDVCTRSADAPTSLAIPGTSSSSGPLMRGPRK